MTDIRTAPTNTTSAYGWVERAFHWAVAIGILAAIGLGVVAYEWPFDTDAALRVKATLFSLHKTVGLTVFFLALARIAWALVQPRPRPLHPEARAETFLAGAVHWLLYGSLVIVPLLGWTHHATTTGFAPIWWPFGQTLPGLATDPGLSALLGSLHKVFAQVLAGAVVLHVAGTAKHLLLDRDLTFARMWRGADPGPLAAAKGHALPLVAALGVWGVAGGVGTALAPETAPAAPATAASVAGASNWEVEAGTLSITVTQLGSPVTGTFADWQAAIDFDEAPRADGTHGTVEVSVSTGSLTLGSVSREATSADFLASEAFPVAEVDAAISDTEDGYVAEGTLSIRGVEVPLRLPFTLAIEGDRAEMTGQVELDRRDFEMGERYPDEANVGFGVTVDVALTAVRTE